MAESGAVVALAVIVSAVEGALTPFGIELCEHASVARKIMVRDQVSKMSEKFQVRHFAMFKVIFQKLTFSQSP
jgi:hypothetical protein